VSGLPGLFFDAQPPHPASSATVTVHLPATPDARQLLAIDFDMEIVP
jgi:hypothetical protein